jgi:hypothetical protein
MSHARVRQFFPCVEELEGRLAPATFTVLNTGDNGGVNPAPFAGTGTLRQAIIDSDATSGQNNIVFAIGSGPQTINLAAALPTISVPTVIQGDTQPGFTAPSNINPDPFFNSPFPLIVINGSGAGTGTVGLNFGASSSGSILQWVIVQGFSGDGIDISSANDLLNSNVVSGNGGTGIHIIGAAATGNRIENSFIGTDKSGNTIVANAGDGVLIDGANNNVVGGGNFFELRNIIAGNGGNGVHITNGASGNLVQADVIGVNTGNNTALPNGGDGVLVDGNGSNNEIGGPIGLGNIISGNNGNGIEIAGTASGTIVFNAFGGTSAFSNLALGNKLDGILVTSSGGGTLLTTNIASANGGYGLHIGGNATGVSVQNLLAGVNFPGIAAIPNALGGILIDGNASNIVIGSPATAGVNDARNTISGNKGNGITVTGNASNITIPINNIGTDSVTGTLPIGNTGAGIFVSSTARNVSIGGGAGANGRVGNIVAFNGGAGILIGAGNTTVTILANIIYGNGGPNVAILGASFLAVGAGPGAGPEVNIYNGATGAILSRFDAFAPGFAGGVRVALADINNDGTPDIICAAGPGGGPEVRVFDGKTLQMIDDFFAFTPAFTGGVWVAAGDINADGFADIICGADAGGGPEVKVFSGANGSVLRDFFAFSGGFTGGVRVASADLNHDGKADIICAAGPGGGPEVSVFDGGTGSPLENFFAFAPSFTGGVFVATGDVNGDGTADIICGAGAGAGPQVTVLDGVTFKALTSFFALPSAFTGGVNVGAVDVNGDGKADIAAAAGPGGGSQVTVYDAATLTPIYSFLAFGSFTGGSFVALR